MSRAGLGRSLGQDGEDKAAAALEKAGMQIITRNFRSKRGEVDIIALDGETLVFIEVKAWSAYGIENLRYSIDHKKQQRIIETAKYFIASHRKYNEMTVRFDVVFVGPEPEGLTHLESAFMERV
ncbi:MAG: YraN family protein [Treponema sp.]|jgi:putative endonuclease|nr:YraN family protein [Treponema sp.]